MLKKMIKALKAQLNWWKNQAAWGKQRREQELRATNYALALICSGALRRQG